MPTTCLALRARHRFALAAWLLTGPLGHLVAGVVDWAELLARYALARARSATARRSRSRSMPGDPDRAG